MLHCRTLSGPQRLRQVVQVVQALNWGREGLAEGRRKLDCALRHVSEDWLFQSQIFVHLLEDKLTTTLGDPGSLALRVSLQKKYMHIRHVESNSGLLALTCKRGNRIADDHHPERNRDSTRFNTPCIKKRRQAGRGSSLGEGRAPPQSGKCSSPEARYRTKSDTCRALLPWALAG